MHEPENKQSENQSGSTRLVESTPPLPRHTTSNKGDPEENFCRKYIWGICDKHQSQCRFQHIRDIELMKKILKFCHDYQNQGCTRPNCSYLHTSREEQNLFKNFGQIPMVLVERYHMLDNRANNMAEMSSMGTPTYSSTPSNAIQPVILQPPPPPPPCTNEMTIRPIPAASINAPNTMPMSLVLQPPPPPPPQHPPNISQARVRPLNTTSLQHPQAVQSMQPTTVMLGLFHILLIFSY